MDKSAGCTVNDIHSQLNRTSVSRIEAPGTMDELQRVVTSVAESGESLSVMGGRHSMGGQQFLSGGVLLDTGRLNRIISLDVERGLAQVEAGILWDTLVSGLQERQQGALQRWSIVQKQTGADRLSIGGALSANGHGRGLTYAPIVQDVESLELVDSQGVLRHCSRTENRELFSLAIGGYGLFGVAYSVTLRLMPFHHLRRTVEITTTDSLEARFADRIADGYTYGDFQYMTDESSPDFLRLGVMSCYRPVSQGEEASVQPPQYLLTKQDWLRLLHLSHSDKARAFDEYAGFYQRTDGQSYDSDTFQLSMYIDDYHRDLDQRLYEGARCNETITEVYVPLPQLDGFMNAAAEELAKRRADVIYGTIRLIAQDDETFLNWASQPYACIVFNLHFQHTESGVVKVADDLRCLIDLATERGGSYFLTYNRFATPEQLTRCYPQFGQFVALKNSYDPNGVFSSDWYRAYQGLP
jgi:FAD/FMN-containing dehydrogenase